MLCRGKLPRGRALALPGAASPLGAPPSPAAGAEFAEQVAALQAATRVLAGVALRSLDVLDGVITLPQFRMLAVLAELGRARSSRVARALGLDASTVTRLADRLVTAGHVARGSDPRHRSVVTLELTPSGERLVSAVSQWRQRELSRIVAGLPARHPGPAHQRAGPAGHLGGGRLRRGRRARQPGLNRAAAAIVWAGQAGVAGRTRRRMRRA